MKLLALLSIVICATPLLANEVTLLVPPLVHPAEIHGGALSADGQWAATGCSDHFLRIWEEIGRASCRERV